MSVCVTKGSQKRKRLRFLKIIDRLEWHVSILGLTVCDTLAQFVMISFTSPIKYPSSTYSSEVLQLSLFSSVAYSIDMAIRLFCLQYSIGLSMSTSADAIALFLLLLVLVGRYLHKSFGFYLAVLYLVFLSLRIILRSHVRQFSKKLHNFDPTKYNKCNICVTMNSVRSSLRSIPGITAAEVEVMETDLIIICGRKHGSISCEELMKFLQKALVYRPDSLSPAEFLRHLQCIDAKDADSLYNTLDVIYSTFIHWGNQRLDLLFSIFVVCINACNMPAQAYLIEQITDRCFIPNSQQSKDDLYSHSFGIMGLCIPFMVGNFGIGYFQSKMISKAIAHIQSDLTSTILSRGTLFFAEHSEGDLNNMFSSDISRVFSLWQAVFWNLLNPLVSVIFGFCYVMVSDWSTGLMALLFSFVLIFSGPQGCASKKSKEFGSKNAYVMAEFQNAISCQKLFRSYGILPTFMKTFDKLLSDLCQISFYKDFYASIVQIYIETGMYYFVAFQIVALAYKVQNEEITTGQFFAFLSLLARISSPVTILGGFMRVAIGNSSSLQRLDEIIFGSEPTSTTECNSVDITKGIVNSNKSEKYLTFQAELPELPLMEKSIELKNVYFKYNKYSLDCILENLNLKIPRGEYVCICGPSGGGKSTLLSCLMQFHTPTSGGILVDGNSIKQYCRSSYMAQVSVVFQEILILNGSILENIRYGYSEASDADCKEAANLAECYFISSLSNEFETIIGQHATENLSGGQAQRICLARALVRKPRLLLLDESTSALDPETETSIITTLVRLSRTMQMAIVSVTHRLSTTMEADLIVVLKQHVIVETGTYKALMEQKGTFSDMVNSTSTPSKQANVQSTTSTRKSVSLKRYSVTKGDNLEELVQFNKLTEETNKIALSHFSNQLSTRCLIKSKKSKRKLHSNHSSKSSSRSNR